MKKFLTFIFIILIILPLLFYLNPFEIIFPENKMLDSESYNKKIEEYLDFMNLYNCHCLHF